MRTFTVLATLAGALALSGCGDTLEQRAATGALGGAAVGAAADAPIAGALAGGAVGAGTGLVQ